MSTHPSRRRFLADSTGIMAASTLTSLHAAEPAATHVLRATRMLAAPDGRERELSVFNKQLPGPVIRAKLDETLRIRVINELGVPTTVHWHGMHQTGTWRMDGVDGVSQTAFPSGSEFLYEFQATPAGTHWFHSHTGVQYADGLYGILIVEDPEPIAVYDREETLFLNDWFLQPADELMKMAVSPKMAKMPKKDMKAMKDKPDVGDIPFQSGLINGKGRYKGEGKSPLTVVNVKKGETLRLRLINGSSTYALRFQVNGHPLTVIASDGQPTKPVEVDNLVLEIGERYDVLLQANQDGAHWIQAATLDGGTSLAVLRYSDAKSAEPDRPVQAWGPRMLKREDLRSKAPVKLAEKPREIPLMLGGSMMPYRWSINGQYFPKADPIEIAKGESIRFLLRNPTMMDHPFHLHGHSFHVLGKPDALNLVDPPLKDTAAVPAKSDLVLQWVANNPGKWFFHCHIEWHLEAGMARVLEIK